MSRFSNSLELVRASGRVLAADKELLVFPLVSGVVSIFVTATFFAPALLFGWLDTMAGGGPAAYAFGFLLYLAQYTVVFFFNTAVVGAALIRLEGGDPTVSDGFRIALDRLGVIVEYAALAATVGMVLRFLSERAGVLGRLVLGFVGLAWNLATYMVVPVLVARDLRPIEAVKESAALFKKTWGEQVVGNAGMGLIFFLAFLAYGALAFPLMIAAASLGPFVLAAAVAAGVGGLVLLAAGASALNGIYAAALYRYATTGEAGFGFESGVLDRAFVPKR